MLGEYFDTSLRAQALRDGPGGSLLEGFAQWLRKAGYAEITARRHIRGAEHFNYWTDRKRIPVRSLNEQVLQRFGCHLSRCQCPGYRRHGHWAKPRTLKSVRLFLEHLRDGGVIHAYVAEPRAKESVLLTAFCQWMRQQRSTGERTLHNYSMWIAGFLRCLGENPHKFDAQSLRAFVLETNRPSCNRGAQTDQRDRAVLLLLARLGLRAGDVAHLRLGDIDWQGAWIAVSGKSKRQTRLPLTQEVGDAIAAYLQDGRPRTNADALFVRAHAPTRAFTNYGAVSKIVARAMQRAGVTCPSRGAAHVLRHSVATSMLRHGASLQDIAAILRHRSIETTQIYAKVHVTALRRIAQPWPEVRPC